MNALSEKPTLCRDPGGSPLGRYQDVIVGERSFCFSLLSSSAFDTPLPGLLGLVLGKSSGHGFLPMRKRDGLRATHHASSSKRISLGSHVIVWDDPDGAIKLKRPKRSNWERVTLADHCILTSKDGWITIGSGCQVEPMIQATSGCSVAIGKDSIIGLIISRGRKL